MRIATIAAWVAVSAFCLTGLRLPEAAAQQGANALGNDTCLGCHGQAGFAMPRPDGRMRSLSVDKEKFDGSVHGKDIPCVGCHQNITEVPHRNVAKTALEWRQSIPNLCGACHAEARGQYLTSVHAKELMQNGNLGAAACSSCHTAHAVGAAGSDESRLAITQNCGNCHVQNLRSFLDTYHGQVHTLGYAYTAKCFDCHGDHPIQRVNDPASTVHPNNRLQTCQRCHLNATPGFVTFQPHATTHDFSRYPQTWIASKFMLALLGGTFAFFWTHSALWFYREYKDRQQHRARPHVRTDHLTHEQGPYYLRWTATWRAAHLGFAICVIMLLITGMTLLHADSFWAPLVQKALGGPQVTGVVHRVFAIGFAGIFFAHLAYVVVRVGRNWRTFDWFGPYSLIPNLQDLTDAIAMFQWFFGLGPRPIFDRYTYWEKFDYWAPFWGVTIIGVSGAILWFKEVAAMYLPGWTFNVATIFHGEEAFLAAGFLFTVHFFNNHWRPDKFPLDIQMFTGTMPLEEFKREHTVEFNRLVQSGELKDYLVDKPSRPLTLGSKILGFILMAVGLTILALILIGFMSNALGGR
jgi:cytochrome b subunit of formate dehydrogenase